MSSQTEYLNLVKPAYSEAADIAVLNSNFDTIDTAIKNIWQRAYPVGAIYISTSSTSPGTLFGGTWERIKDRFLLAAGDTYSAAATGGSATHTLTVSEMPSHNHSFTGSAVTSGGISANHYHSGTSGGQSAGHTHSGPSHTHSIYAESNSAAAWSGQGAAKWTPANSWNANTSWDYAMSAAGTGSTGSNSADHTHTTTTGNQSAGHTHSVTASGSIGNKGGGTAFSIMPPYLAVYMWKRTA